MDRATGKFERHLYDPAHPEKLSRPPLREIVNLADDHITFIKQDVTGVIWIGAFEGGLNRYDPKTKLVSHYEAKSDPDSLHEMGTWDMYSSREGVVWIITSSGSLYRIDPFQKEIPHYVTPSALVHYFYEEPNGILWIGTHQELIRAGRDKGIIKRYVIRIDSSIGNDNWIHIIK